MKHTLEHTATFTADEIKLILKKCVADQYDVSVKDIKVSFNIHNAIATWSEE